MNLPAIENTFVCIANIDTPDLTAIVSSYIYTENQYPLIFEFPSATDYVFYPHFFRPQLVVS